MTSPRTRRFLGWVLAYTLAAILGLVLAWLVIVSDVPPVDYRVQLPTLEMP